MLKKTHDKPGRGSDPSPNNRGQRGLIRSVGLGAVTGAADDDCSAIGTYASAGAQFGTSLLWTAPITFPMMCAVVYLSSKLGQVNRKGLVSRRQGPLPAMDIVARFDRGPDREYD